MKATIKLTLTVWFFSFFVGVVIGEAMIAADVKIQHFEDGSGRITYCLPFSWCADK